MIKEILSRRSIRKFQKDKPVSKAQLEQMLAAAMFAPSACNSRPWEFIVVTKREILDEIAKGHPAADMCSTATAAIIMVLTPQSGIPEGFYPQDGGAATQNILLEAAAMDLGTCWCGVYPKPPTMDFIRKLLDIPENKIPFNVIAVGVPDEHPEPKGFFEEGKVSYVG
jgi:nitroreductase